VELFTQCIDHILLSRMFALIIASHHSNWCHAGGVGQAPSTRDKINIP